MRNCWDLKGCPASHYANCTAYQKGVNCWDIKKGCLCHAYRECDDCPIYLKRQLDLDRNKMQLISLFYQYLFQRFCVELEALRKLCQGQGDSM